MAEYWANGPSITDDEILGIIEQMKSMGAQPAQIQAFKSANTPDECLVLKENHAAVEWFLDVDDLFVQESGIMIGLNVNAIKADAEMRNYKIIPEDYNKLRMIGRVAASTLNARHIK